MIWLFLLLINLHFKKIMTTYLNASVSSISVLDLKSLYENLDNYIKFDLTQDKFAFFEKFNSGSNFREGWKKGLEFLIKRQKDLHQEFLENEKAGYGYGTSYNVCKSYWDENFLAYETTRGTVIILGFEDTNKYYVLLPKNRMGGTHHKHLILALAGMTADIWEKETIEGDYTERIVKLRAKNNSIIFLKTFYIPIKDQNGNITKITAVSDDITTQKEQEKLIQKNITDLEVHQEELEKREKFLESLLSILDEVPALVGRATLGGKLEIVYVNEYGEELIGYDANYIKKNGFSGFIHREDLPKLAQITKEKLAKGDNYSASFRVVTKDKKVKTVWEYAQKVDFNGQECIDFFIIDPSIISKNDI